MFPIETGGKLKDRQIGPCKILAKYEPKGYKLEQPEGITINHVFNIAELKKYHAPNGFQLTDPT